MRKDVFCVDIIYCDYTMDYDNLTRYISRVEAIT